MHRNDSTQAASIPDSLRLLNESDLVFMGLATSVHTLRTWRAQNRGPAFVKVGRLVKYRLPDIHKFLASLPQGGGGDMQAVA